MKILYLLRKGLFLFILLTGVPVAGLGAELRALEKSNSIVIDGKIVPGDYDKLVKLVLNHGVPSRFTIRSSGGSVVEAMKIGRLVRSSLADVLSVDECQSACSLILLAAVELSPLGSEVGIHRPRFTPEEYKASSFENADASHRNLNDMVKEYLIEMDAPYFLIEKTLKTPSNDMAYVSISDINEMRGDKAPAYDEWTRGSCNGMSAIDEDDALSIEIINMNNFLCQSGGMCKDLANGDFSEKYSRVSRLTEKEKSRLLFERKRFEECVAELKEVHKDRLAKTLRNNPNPTTLKLGAH